MTYYNVNIQYNKDRSEGSINMKVLGNSTLEVNNHIAAYLRDGGYNLADYTITITEAINEKDLHKAQT